MKILVGNKKLVWIILTAVALAILFLVLRSKAVETNNPAQSPVVEKATPMVLVSKDKDGYGLEIEARELKNVRKVEMLVKYEYKGRVNPPLLASGPPQQESYWAHFRLESCSRGDCIYYKVSQVKFSLILSYPDGESREYGKTILMKENYQQTPLRLDLITS